MTNPAEKKDESTRSRDIELIRRDIRVLKDQVFKLEQKTSSIDTAKIGELTHRVDRLIVLIDGDNTTDTIGLRKRLETIENTAEQMMEERKMVKWILAGLGASGITNVGAIIALVTKILGA